MRFFDLGRSGTKVSAVGYGCMRIAGTWDRSKFSPELEAVGRSALLAAWESGYTLFDHADIYAHGECESIHGRLLKENPTMRDEILLATKCGIRWAGDAGEDSPHRYDFSKKHILWSCEQSLRRLQTDRIDLYQLHRPDYLMDPHEVAEAFSELSGSGKVRWFGVSNFSPSFVETLQAALPDPLLVNQVEVSFGHLDRFRDGTLDQCLKLGMTPLSWSPVAGGWLASDSEPEHVDRISIWKLIGEMAEKYKTDRAGVCFAWLLRHPSRIIPIVGSTNPERIKSAEKSTEILMSREDWYSLFVEARGEKLA